MLSLKRRCIVADPDGIEREFRVLSALADGALLLLSAQDADAFRFKAGGGDGTEVLRFLRDHAVALDPATGLFLTTSQLKGRLEQAASPFLRLVGLTA